MDTANAENVLQNGFDDVDYCPANDAGNMKTRGDRSIKPLGRGTALTSLAIKAFSKV